MQDPGASVAGVLRMSGAAEQPTRVLVVRSGPLRDRVAAAIEAADLSAEVEVSPSYLSAMGWLTRERVDVIIGPVSAMTGMVGSTARALRRLAPAARLVVVAGGNERAEAAAALSAGFDGCIDEPADATTLLAALQLPANQRDSAHLADIAEVTAQTQSSATAQGVPPTPAAASESASTSAPSTTERASIKPDLFDLDFDDAPPMHLHGAIGDVDLAEAVLRSDGTMIDLALRLMREQSGIADLTYTPTDSALDEPAPAVVVDVVFAGKRLGMLGTSTRDTDALLPWAGWLARWVALEARQDALYQQAMRDELTGLWNRRYFDRFLGRLLRHASQDRQQVTLMVFDIDDFKQYNDRFGHPAGDAILRAAATLMQSVVREHDVVARIGGDEFAVVFWDKGEPRQAGSQHPDNVIGIAKRFQKAICAHQFPELGEDAVGSLTVSGGLAAFPWDGRTPADLLARADKMALQSKRQGKNAICFGPAAAPNGNVGH